MFGVLDLRVSNHIVSEARTQISRRPQINPCTQQLGKFSFHARQPDQTNWAAGIELYKHVDIAIGAKASIQNRTE